MINNKNKKNLQRKPTHSLSLTQLCKKPEKYNSAILSDEESDPEFPQQTIVRKARDSFWAMNTLENSPTPRLLGCISLKRLRNQQKRAVSFKKKVFHHQDRFKKTKPTFFNLSKLRKKGIIPIIDPVLEGEDEAPITKQISNVTNVDTDTGSRIPIDTDKPGRFAPPNSAVLNVIDFIPKPEVGDFDIKHKKELFQKSAKEVS